MLSVLFLSVQKTKFACVANFEEAGLRRKVYFSCCLFDEQHGRTGSHACFLTKSRSSRTHNMTEPLNHIIQSLERLLRSLIRTVLFLMVFWVLLPCCPCLAYNSPQPFKHVLLHVRPLLVCKKKKKKTQLAVLVGKFEKCFLCRGTFLASFYQFRIIVRTALICRHCVR